LFGLFGWKSAPQRQVASADSTTPERQGHSAATGSILAPKIKFAPQGYAVASATPNEPYKNDSPNGIPEMQQTVAANDSPNGIPEMQQTVAALATSPPQQEAASATVSIVPTETADSFESRWSGLQKAKVGLAFDARWALDSR
jgi:hypothetical protein